MAELGAMPKAGDLCGRRTCWSVRGDAAVHAAGVWCRRQGAIGAQDCHTAEAAPFSATFSARCWRSGRHGGDRRPFERRADHGESDALCGRSGGRLARRVSRHRRVGETGRTRRRAGARCRWPPLAGSLGTAPPPRTRGRLRAGLGDRHRLTRPSRMSRSPWVYPQKARRGSAPRAADRDLYAVVKPPTRRALASPTSTRAGPAPAESRRFPAIAAACP